MNEGVRKGEVDEMDLITRVVGLLVLFLFALGGAACTKTPGSEVPLQVLELEPELFITINGESRMMQAGEVFDEGKRRLESEDYRGCAKIYDLLWPSLSSTSDYYIASIYNSGLCHEHLQGWGPASERYLKLTEEFPNTRDGLDAVFRLAEVAANQKKWGIVDRLMSGVLSSTPSYIRHLDRIEGFFRKGMALVALGELVEAETTFKDCLKKNTMGGRATLPRKHNFVSGCHYGKALVYHLLFSELKFTLPAAKMKRDIEVKRQLSKKAYDNYVRTIRAKNGHWATIAGYMVGKLYEDFYFDILTAELPESLTDEEMDDYFESLREELSPFIDEALKIYSKTASISERVGAQHQWAQAAEDRLKRLQRYRENPPLLRAEEARIIELQLRIGEEGVLPFGEGIEVDFYPKSAAPSAKLEKSKTKILKADPLQEVPSPNERGLE